ncbi:unnamed protein product [Adineta ricciae]|uniref:BioF2-like acetyltransferase domain-containing protein n=1 Tax=Adineta ricciae TaxID=249248 RepID=A0A814B1D4_ADIRI|nr:unnamed protein product [Adineta ricciae]CAF1184111.1 unnamed protein product [Adineta ricciae]
MTSTTDNSDVHITISAIPESKLNLAVRRKLRTLIIFNSVILIGCSIVFFACIYINVVNARKKQKHDKWSYFVYEMFVTSLSSINAILGLVLIIYEQRKHEDQQSNYKLVNVIHLVSNIVCTILFSLVFIIDFIYWSADLSNTDQVYNGVRLAVMVLTLIIGICQTACAIENRVLAWSPKYRYSRFVLCFSSTVLMAVSIASIIFNARIGRLQQRIEANSTVPLWCYTTFQASSSYTLLCGLVGVCLTFVYGRKESGPNQFRKRLRQLFNVVCGIGLVLIVSFTINLLSYRSESGNGTNRPHLHTLVQSDPIVSAVQCILLIFAMRSLHILVRATRPARNGLTIERIWLNQTSPACMTHWAAGIDAFNGTLDGMTGEAALQLMKAYENGQLESTECVVLRIGRSGQRVQLENDQWDDTEALVLLTIIHKYDVMSKANFNGFWGNILQRTLGSKNCTPRFRPLLLRLGLIGYQWPFRTSIFFTTPHQDPLTRAAHVLEAIIDWNEMQKSNTHCNVLLLPTLSTELVAKAIPAAGFFPFSLPPTHLVDVRPHHGKTWAEYMKTLKKGNRRPYIQQFLTKGGTIEEIDHLSPSEVGDIVCQQFENIVRVRRENKEPPPLVKPSAEFISSMGNNMNVPYRSVVFLRFNGEVIASSVIYKFPYKILTTDIQGLTHEKARPLKAYFVMLQWVLREALEKKYDFVDFGPTTPGPKTDLGCVSVPLEAGGYAGNPILAFGIQQAGRVVDVIHNKKDNQQHKTLDHDGDQQNDTQLNIQPPTDNIQTSDNVQASRTDSSETRSAVPPSKKVKPPAKKGRNLTGNENQSRPSLPKDKQMIDEPQPFESTDIVSSNTLVL